MDGPHAAEKSHGKSTGALAMKAMRVFLIMLAAIGLGCASAHAQTAQDRLISGTFKTLAKTYIATTDFNALKKNTITRLQQLDTDSFHERYPNTLQLIDDAPVLTKQFGLRSDMSREQAVAFIRSLDKKKASAVIDAVPDQVVARRVMQNFSQKTHPAKSKNIMDRVRQAWQDIQNRLDRTVKGSRE
jgi:hypothetical protein